MARLRKHYILTVGTSKTFDRWIVTKLVSWAEYLSRNVPSHTQARLVSARLQGIMASPTGWRKRLLALWEIVKPYADKGGYFGGAVLLECSHRSGSASNSTFVTDSIRWRGSLKRKKRARGGVVGLDAGIAVPPPPPTTQALFEPAYRLPPNLYNVR